MQRLKSGQSDKCNDEYSSVDESSVFTSPSQTSESIEEQWAERMKELKEYESCEAKTSDQTYWLCTSVHSTQG